jgi:hypothetical protein
MAPDTTEFSAAASALGYIYQPRYALFSLFHLPEITECWIERDDDIDFSDPDEGKILASLKHKAEGDTLSNLSPDFWKSVRIWAIRYLENPTPMNRSRYFLFTTGSVATGSLLVNFLPGMDQSEDLAAEVSAKLAGSDSKTLAKTRVELEKLTADQRRDFFRRITIFDQQVRIHEIPQQIIDKSLRTVRIQFREAVYQRLEGWWFSECIKLLSGDRATPLRGFEVSEMLSFFTEQFREENLPIDFEDAEPEEGVHPDSDNRNFVRQLRAIGLRSERIKRAILDYYRACQQRGEWLRLNVTLNGEIERYDDRLIDEWKRLKEIIWEELKDEDSDETLQQLGRKLYTDLSTRDHPNLRIRRDVTATYVAMGSYHHLANDRRPRVHWHPQFESRTAEIFGNKES